MYHYIYRIDFLKGEEGRYYIGKRSSSAKPTNDHYYRGSGLFCKYFFNKYGTDGTYIKTILEINPNKETNAEREKFYIGDLYKTDPLCMNFTEGGLNGGRHQADHNGENNPFYGRHHSLESRRLISEHKKGIKYPRKWSRKVGKYSLDGELISIYNNRYEMKSDGLNPKCVDNVLSGRSKTHKHYYFKIL